MIINIKNFNLEQIADSGQCFRWRKLDEGKYLIPAIVNFHIKIMFPYFFIFFPGA